MPELGQTALDLVQSLLDQRLDVFTWRVATISDVEDLTDLSEREPSSLSVLDEDDPVDRAGGVVAVAPGRASRFGQQPAAFVEAQRLCGQTGAISELTDKHAHLRLDLPVHWKAYGSRPEGLWEVRRLTEVTLLYFEGCPSWRTVDRRLRALADELDFELTYQTVGTTEAAEKRNFRGSPTVLVDGRDVFATGDEPVGPSCRIYQTPEGPAGAPTVTQLREVLSQ